jgi:hypothetical protein
MTIDEFEVLLEKVAQRLEQEVRADAQFRAPSIFEMRARTVLQESAEDEGFEIDLAPPAQAFPDIVVDEFGIEVKVNSADSWRSVANSVFEGSRVASVRHIYILFGKMGGTPSVKWGRYEDCVMHVRTSHVPRFEVEINPKQTLFAKIGIPYAEFSQLAPDEKMRHVRAYARGRLKKGERLWWLEDKEEQEHTLPIQARLYKSLPQKEKRQMRAEAAILCPQIVKGSRSRDKYDDATLYLLTYRGVLCPQARDLFSAGSVALRADETRGGLYIMRALQDIEAEMRQAAATLDDALFLEYWGVSTLPEERIKLWLARADAMAQDWKPSDILFLS